MRLRGKACIVTGGASGMGRATSLMVAREDAAVVVVDRSEARTRAMALNHVDDTIRLTAVAPGRDRLPPFPGAIREVSTRGGHATRTRGTSGHDRLGQPEDIANAILFLASNEASFLTGSFMKVDGSMTAQ